MKLTILSPSIDKMIIPYGSSFLVSGEIKCDKTLKKPSFKCEVFNFEGELVRSVSSSIKDNKSIKTDIEDLTLYPKGIDDNLSELKDFGFCELLVDEDGNFNKASSKCYFSDNKFRCLIYSSSNIENGSIFDDGLNFVDDFGNYYKALDKGEYKVVVSLYDDNKLLMQDHKDIVIGSYGDTLICRVNPKEHKLNMFKWAKENNYAAWIDDLPGYLAPYHNDEWYYHMGLLNFYRANDICLYKEGRVHMFIYQTASNSTSYETEYAYLQSVGDIDNTNRFVSYAYDIGETKIKDKIGKIIELKDDIHLYRIDVVTPIAQENIYDINELNNIDSKFENYEFEVGDKIAISGVVKPYQLDKSDFILRKNNTYEIKNRPAKLIYEFICDEEIKIYSKELNMLRYKDKELERSVFEFYNLFEIDNSFKDKTWTINIKMFDLKNENAKSLNGIKIKVI